MNGVDGEGQGPNEGNHLIGGQMSEDHKDEHGVENVEKNVVEVMARCVEAEEGVGQKPGEILQRSV